MAMIRQRHIKGKWTRTRLLGQILLPLLLLGGVLVACGGAPKPRGEAQSPVETALPASATAEAASAQSGASTAKPAQVAPTVRVMRPEIAGDVTLWHHWSSPLRRNALRRVLAICKKQLPRINVTDIAKPYGEVWAENIAAVAAGSGMLDVIVEDRPKLPDRAMTGIDQSLGELAKADGIDGSEFWPFTWEETLYEGRSYGLPFETDVRVLYYSKTALREVGLDPNKPPRTWNEIEQYADKLDRKNADGSYERIGFFPLFSISPDMLAFTNGVEWISEDNKARLNSPEAVETMTWIKRWVDRYGGWEAIQSFRSKFAGGPNDAFKAGQLAMVIDINSFSAQLNFSRPQITTAEGKTELLEWGITDLPYKARKGSWSGGFALSIPRGAPQADAAWEFIKCATGPEAQASWARDTYAMPANRRAASDPVLLADPNWQLFVDAMEYTTGTGFVPKYPNWFEQLHMRYEPMWRGELPPEVALDQAQQIVERELSK